MISYDELKRLFTEFDEPPLARGGQKVVFRAAHPQYGDVVVKIPLKKSERVQREIRLLIEHPFDETPRVFAVEDVLYEGAETQAVVEEYVDGTSLDKFIASGGRFNLTEADAFLQRSLEFLVKLSDHGIVHRDIKPNNIILADGKPVFLDFGIARFLDEESLTATGFMGPNTPGYAPPEVFNGLKDQIDGRADLFSIGVVTYELLTGDNPFRVNASSRYQILKNTETITPASYFIPGDDQLQFMGLLSSLMSKQVAARPRNARQALEWLESARRTYGGGAPA